jgi:hypothetical protein
LPSPPFNSHPFTLEDKAEVTVEFLSCRHYVFDMSQLTDTELLSKPARFLAMLAHGDHVSIVTSDGELLGTALPASPDDESSSVDMKSWAAEIEARLQQSYKSRVSADSADLLNEMRADRF